MIKLFQYSFLFFIIYSCSNFAYLTPQIIQDTAVKGTDYITQKNIIVSPQGLGQVVLFVSSVCPCSASFENEINKLFHDYKNHFSFIAINSSRGENDKDAAHYFKNVNFPTPVIKDHKLYYANLYKALKTPHAFVIDPIGEILYQGGIGESNNGFNSNQNFPLRQALLQITQNQKITTPISPVFGCSISR